MRLGEVLAMDLYAILEVDQDAPTEEIRRAYRRLAVTSHPDLNPGRREAAEHRMVEINVAASVLLDSVRRGVYDRARARKARSRPAPSGPWDFWHSSAADGDDWTGPEPAPARRLEGEIRDAVRGFRSWPARTLHELLRLTASSSPSSHALFTIASVGLALLLIGVARPRSLSPQSEERTAEVAAEVAPSPS